MTRTRLKAQIVLSDKEALSSGCVQRKRRMWARYALSHGRVLPSSSSVGQFSARNGAEIHGHADLPCTAPR